MNRFAPFVVAACFTACGAGSVTGTVAGAPLSVQDAVFFATRDGNGQLISASVVLSDKPSLCEALKANRVPHSVTTFSISLQNLSGEGANAVPLAVDVGDYTVADPTSPRASGRSAIGVFSRTDASCNSTLSGTTGWAKSGLVKVRALQAEPGGTAQATFDFAFGAAADTLTGSFTARFCEVTPVPEKSRCD